MLHDDRAYALARGNAVPVTAGSEPGCVLLVEFLSPGRFGDHKGRAFPFLAGLARGLGHEVRWLCLPAEVQVRGDDATRVDLDDRGRVWLLGLLDLHKPTHVLLSEVPRAELDHLMRERVSEVLYFARPGPLESGEAAFWRRWLGHDESGPAWLVDSAQPDYQATRMELDGCPALPITTLYAGPACAYAAPIHRNPIYDGIHLKDGARPFGCAFCGGPPRLAYAADQPHLALLMSQLRRAAAEARSARSRNEFQIDSAWAMCHIDVFIGAVAADGLAPSAFYLACRADEVLLLASRIEGALGTARRAGHQLHIVSIGVENFSPAENARFNKNLSADQIRQAVHQMRDWERDFPGTFHYTEHGGLGFILFTPWTTLDDARINAAAVRELGADHARFFLTRRLMLLPDLPITQLADRDGLLGVRTSEERHLFHWFERHCDPGCRHWTDEKELSWHFRDDRLTAVCALALRMCLSNGPPVDPVHERMRGLATGRSGTQVLDLFEILLDIVSEPGAPLSMDLIGEALARRVGTGLQEPASLETHPRQDAILERFRRVAAMPTRPLRGFELRSASVDAQSDGLKLDFFRGQERFCARVLPASHPAPCFLRTGRFAFSYDASDVLSDQEQGQLLLVVSRVLTGASK